MSGILIDFRKQDEPSLAALLQRELSSSFSTAAVFYASTTSRPDDNSERGLLHEIRNTNGSPATARPHSKTESWSTSWRHRPGPLPHWWRRTSSPVPVVRRFAVLEVFDVGWEPTYCLDTPDA